MRSVENDPRLLAAIDQLRTDVEFDFVIVDHWPTDLTATGIARVDDERHLVYISLVNDIISFECERPPTSPDFPYDSDAMVTNADYKDLLLAVQTHLSPPANSTR